MEKKKDGGKNREKSSLCETLQTTAIFSDGSPSLSTMKRHGSSDFEFPADESSSPVEDFESNLRDGLDEDGQILEKKRRLSVDQVKALEKNFELENKLEPERKLKLAQELGLQPRQVAVWFQNRRARWKTKQLERDYALLKSNFDSLKKNYDSLKHDNQSLLLQITDLKSKLYGDDQETSFPFKQDTATATAADDDAKSPQEMAYVPDFKDGSSDSDSSAILNEDNNSSNMAAMADVMNCHQITESKAVMGDAQTAYQPQFVKIEEHNFFSGEESCNFFSDDQAPTLQWYCQDQWNLTEEN